MTDGFSDPNALFEEFEKEPVSRFNLSSVDEETDQPRGVNGVNGQNYSFNGRPGVENGGGGGGLYAKTPKELLEEPPGIQLTFLNHPKFLKHRSAIEIFFARLMSMSEEDDDDGIRSAPQPLPQALDLAPPGSQLTADAWRTGGCVQLYPEFFLDAFGHPLVQLTHELTIGWDIPPFERLFEKYIPLEEEEGLVPKVCLPFVLFQFLQNVYGDL